MLTTKEFYKLVSEENITEEVIEYAKKKLEPTAQEVAKSTEYKDMVEKIIKFFDDNPTRQITQTDLGVALGVSSSKVGYALRTYVMDRLDRVRDTKTGVWLYFAKKS